MKQYTKPTIEEIRKIPNDGSREFNYENYREVVVARTTCTNWNRLEGDAMGIKASLTTKTGKDGVLIISKMEYIDK